MDFANPNKLLGNSVEVAVLMVLSAAEIELTGRQVAARVERSPQGVLNALNRLVEQGIVTRRAAGRAMLYSLSRDHVAAPWLQGMTSLPQQLLQRIRDQIKGWDEQPVSAAVFGSVARGEAGPASDVDLFLVRSANADQGVWEKQVEDLASGITRWSGNDTQVLEFDEDDLSGGAVQEPVIERVLAEGIEVGGSLRAVRRRVRG